MKKVFFSLLALVATFSLSAQGKFFSKDANVAFDANSPLEKIEGKTNKGTLVIDAATGKVESAVLIKGFHFKSALMEEHFNENYMESGKFPKSTFAGDITNFSSVNLKKDGTYPIQIKGNLTMHGVTKPVEAKGSLVVKGGAITNGSAAFKVLMADYGIAIPAAVKDKIAKEAKIDISAALQKLVK
ncbi:MAG: YceI family protein [Saprospiraceae bacterium]|nr:YceI family protein [Saprospiraceae bacterium]